MAEQIQPSFARGELSPRLRARVDIEYYKSGLAKCQNFYVMRHGGIRRRPGSRYIGQANGPAVIRPFIFSVDQRYVIEFGDHYLRFHTRDGTVVDTIAHPYTVVSPWAIADVAKLQFQQLNDVIRVTHVNYPPKTIRRYGELDWRILDVVFEDGPYQDIVTDGTILQPSSNGGIIQGVTSATTPGLGSCGASSEWAFGGTTYYPAWQAFDGNGNTEWMAGEGSTTNEYLIFTFETPKIITGYVVGSSPREENYADTNGDSTVIYKIPGSLRAPRGWVFEGQEDGGPFFTLDQQAAITGWGEGERRYFTFQNVKPLKSVRFRVTDINQSSSILRPVSIGTLKFSTGGDDIGLVTFVVSSIQSINKGQGFTPNDVGRLIRFLSEDAYWHWFRIIGYVSAIQVDAEMYSPPLPSTNGTISFRLGAFGNVCGWPARVGIFQDRIFYARTNEQPQTVWGSRTDDFDNFTTSIPAKADDSVNFTVAAAGEIQWLQEADNLLFATTTATRSMGAANKNEGFSATNFSQGTPLQTGAFETAPARAGVSALFVGRLGTTLHELTFSFEVNSYVAPDIAVMSEHLLRVGVKEIAWAYQPNAILWMVMNDGTFCALTYEREQKMQAISQHAMGGGGLVESVCVVPGPDRDEVWFVVNRAGTRTVELLEADYEGDPQPDAFYLDCGVTYDGDPTTLMTGLPFCLRNKTVSMLADGGVEKDAPVDAIGEVAVPSGEAASTIHVGYNYTSIAETLRIAEGLGGKKVLKGARLELLETGGVKCVSMRGVGPQQSILRRTDDTMDAAVPFFTGTTIVRFQDSWKNAGAFQIICDEPAPCTVLAVTPMFDAEP